MLINEIERKFLVAKIDSDILEDEANILQGYLSTNPPVRVRIIDGGSSFLTIKSGSGKERQEFTYEIPLEEAESLIELSRYNLIKKKRYHTEGFEIDVFQEKLIGLVLAEIELDSTDQPIQLPIIIVAKEVTGNLRFENQNLAKLNKIPKEWRCKNFSRDL